MSELPHNDVPSDQVDPPPADTKEDPSGRDGGGGQARAADREAKSIVMRLPVESANGEDPLVPVTGDEIRESGGPLEDTRSIEGRSLAGRLETASVTVEPADGTPAGDEPQPTDLPSVHGEVLLGRDMV